MGKPLSPNVGSEGEHSSDFQLLCLHELNLTLLSLIKLFLGLGTLSSESFLQFRHSSRGSVAIN